MGCVNVAHLGSYQKVALFPQVGTFLFKTRRCTSQKEGRDVDTRSPSPRWYRLITHKVQGHQRYLTSACPPHHNYTRERTCQGLRTTLLILMLIVERKKAAREKKCP